MGSDSSITYKGYWKGNVRLIWACSLSLALISTHLSLFSLLPPSPLSVHSGWHRHQTIAAHFPVPLPSDALFCLLQSMMQMRRQLPNILGQQPLHPLPRLNEMHLGCWLAWTGEEQHAVSGSLNLGLGGVKQPFCFVFLPSSAALQARCWCSCFQPGRSCGTQQPFALGEEEQVHGRDPSRGKKGDASYFWALLKCLNPLRRLGVKCHQQFALGKGKRGILPTCTKASILMWQQPPWCLHLASGLPLKRLLYSNRLDTVFPLHYLLRDLKYPSRFPPCGWMCWCH